MKLTELLSEIGDDNIGLQNLSQCVTKMHYSKKKGHEYTFLSDQPFGPQGPEKACLILWIDRAVAAQALETLNQKEK